MVAAGVAGILVEAEGVGGAAACGFLQAVLAGENFPADHRGGYLGIEGDHFQAGAGVFLGVAHGGFATPYHDLVEILGAIEDRLDLLVSAFPVGDGKGSGDGVVGVDLGHCAQDGRGCEQVIGR
ncbi:hypothetical protein D3C78_1388760 [compost metagenome]